MQPVDDIADRDAQGVAIGGVHAAGDRPVEPQAGQMSSDRGVDDVGRGVVLPGSVEQRGNIDTPDVRFSHTGYDVGETQGVPPDLSGAR